MASYQDDEPYQAKTELPVDFEGYGNGPGRFYGLTKTVQYGFLVFFFIISVLLAAIIGKNTDQLPDVRVLEDFRPNESSRIFDRYGGLIANIHGDEDRVVVSLKQVSPYVKKAVLATEDYRFYEHNGVDIRGTIRAFATNINADESVQGGSTITQQLVKNLFLSPEKSYKRKLAEAILAVRVEKHYTKDKILEMYLNQVYFGNLSYGIEKAARRYFKKPAKRLTLAESAVLAGLLKAPEGLSPYNYPEAARKRQLEVLQKMRDYGYITQAQMEEGAAQKIVLNSRESKPSKYPYFVTYVIQELENRYGRDVVRRGGLDVYTTLDPKAQDAAEAALTAGVEGAKFSGVKQGALVAMDVQTGEVLALVGGVDFIHNQFNSATQAHRAVGSTFKPFVYLTGFRMEKIFPKSPISDRPVYFRNSWGQSWSPHNWDGKYMGAMNIRKALTLSRNTPTVQIGMKVGIDEVIKTARAAGIKSPIDANFSSFLGSAGVAPIELVTAYSTLARGGIYIEPTTVKRVVDNRGRLVNIDSAPSKRVFDQDYVAAVVDILIDVVEKGTGKNAMLEGRTVAGKTGTTDQVRDIWFMGFTPDVVAGVWMGNPNNQPLHGVFSSNSAKVWHDFMTEYYKIHPTPPQKFFIASNEYAARAGLVHLIDPEGMKEAAARMKIVKMDTDETDDTTAQAGGEPDGKKNNKAAHKKAAGTTAETNIPLRDEPANNPAPVTAPAGGGGEEQKFDRWKNTLDNVEQHLNN